MRGTVGPQNPPAIHRGTTRSSPNRPKAPPRTHLALHRDPPALAHRGSRCRPAAPRVARRALSPATRLLRARLLARRSCLPDPAQRPAASGGFTARSPSGRRSCLCQAPHPRRHRPVHGGTGELRSLLRSRRGWQACAPLQHDLRLARDHCIILYRNGCCTWSRRSSSYPASQDIPAATAQVIHHRFSWPAESRRRPLPAGKAGRHSSGVIPSSRPSLSAGAGLRRPINPRDEFCGGMCGWPYPTPGPFPGRAGEAIVRCEFIPPPQWPGCRKWPRDSSSRPAGP
jgi:hypothetical protein